MTGVNAFNWAVAVFCGLGAIHFKDDTPAFVSAIFCALNVFAALAL